MKINKFTIHSYKAIEKDLVVNMETENVLALIGLNECGKTTILKAITAFDSRCDKYHETYRQFKDLDKKYKTYGDEESKSSISCQIVIETTEEKDIVKNKIIENNWFSKDENNSELYIERKEEVVIDENGVEQKKETTSKNEEKYTQAINELLNNPLNITRTITNSSKFYNVNCEKLSNTKTDEQNAFVELILSYCPSILLFYDKMESIEKVNITEENISKKIVDNIFKTVKNITLEKFFALKEDAQGSYMNDINNKLNEQFMDKWNSLSINKEFGKLKIQLQFKTEEKSVSLKIIEIIKVNEDGNIKEYERQFSLKDRSEGFNWYFRFVLTLLYYPSENENNSKIFLFDEPGLYLHEHAQINLSKTFQDLSEKNIVIYTTHCHGMLNIDLTQDNIGFTLKNIFIVAKEPNEYIKLIPSYDYMDSNDNESRTAAFKPILNALQIGFASLFQHENPVVIVEGINDFYILKGLLREKLNGIAIFPSTGANNILKQLPYFIMRETPMAILFDNDAKGLECANNIKEYFKERIYKMVLFLNKGSYQTTKNDGDKWEIENYFLQHKEEYCRLFKIKGHNWFSKFAEKVYKNDLRSDLSNVDSNLLNDFEELLAKIKAKF